MKLLPLIERAIRNSTDSGEVVLVFGRRCRPPGA